MDLRSPPIDVEIEELILHGAAAADRHIAAYALADELAALLRAGALPPHLLVSGATERLDLGTIEAPSQDPKAISAGVAQALMRTWAGGVVPASGGHGKAPR
jgi:hypothetical protein